MELMLRKSEFDQICRTCLKSKADMLLLKTWDFTNIYLSLIEIEQNDRLPSLICKDCTSLIETFFKFKQQCKKSEEMLWNILNTEIAAIKTEKNDTNDTVTNKFIENDSSFSIEAEDSFILGTEINESVIAVDEKIFKNEEDNLTTSNDVQLKNKKNAEYFITCELCNKKICQNSIYHHLRRHKMPKKHICDKCSNGYCNPNELAKHRARVHKIKESIKCHVCCKRFQIQAQLNYHMRRHFKKNYSCNVCNKTFFDKAKIRRHKVVHEKRSKTIFCLRCDKMFSREECLKVHNRRYHDHTGNLQLQKNICNICGKSVFNLKAHILQKHSIERPFKCDKCEKSYVIKYQLNNHIKEMHCDQETKEKKCNALCNICGKPCESMADLKRHLISHSDFQPFQCEICENRYKSEASLNYHRRSKHNDVRSYKCEYCCKAFYTNQILKTHLRIHTGERPFVCEICTRTFTQNSSLRTHMKIHKL